MMGLFVMIMIMDRRNAKDVVVIVSFCKIWNVLLVLMFLLLL